MMKMVKSLRIPLLFVAGHTTLLILTAIAMILPLQSNNQDSSIGFIMMVITFYVIDFPIGLLFEALRPYYSLWGGWFPTVLFLYGLIANLMWFMIGLVAYYLTKRWSYIFKKP